MGAITDNSGLVGRIAESDALKAALTNAAAGRGRTMLISGEAGIGKTEFVIAAAAEARARGITCGWGAGAEVGGAPAYWPWIQVLRELCQALGPELAIRCFVPEGPVLGALLPELAAAVRSPTAEFALYDAVRSVIVRAAAITPLVLILDDLHVCGTPTIRMTHHVARGIHRSRVLLIATVRPGLDPAVMEPLAATAEQVELGGLTDDGITELVRRSTGQRPSAELVGRIRDRTDGNALFVGEVARLLATDRTAGTRNWPVPTGIRQAIRQRLTQLGPAHPGSAADLLETAAVVGREFELAVVSEVCGLSWQEMQPILDQAVAARLISRAPEVPGRARFAHVLVRDTLYDDLPGKRRAELHAAVTDALTRRLDESDPARAATLAHHCLRALPLVDLATAARRCEEAGLQAATTMAHETATRYFEDATEVLAEQVPPDLAWRCRLLLRLGESLTKGGDPRGGRRILFQAADLARRLGDDESLAHAALRSADRLDFNEIDAPVIGLLREAAESLAGQESLLRARLLARLAVATYHADRDGAVELSRQAVEDARRTGDPATVAHALSGWIYAVWGIHDPAEVLAAADDIIRSAAQLDDPQTEVDGRLWRMIFQLEAGAATAVEREIHAVERLAGELRQPFYRLMAASRAATLATVQGRFDDAGRLALEAWQIGRQGEEPDADAVYWVQVFSIWLQAEVAPDALEEMESILRKYTAGSAVSHVPGLVVFCLRRGLRDEAIARYGAIRAAGVEALPRDMNLVWNLCLLTMAAVDLSDAKFAEQLYSALLPYADRTAVCAGAVSCIGSVSHYLGLLAVTIGRRDEARRHFGAAIRHHEQMGATPMLAESRDRYARLTTPSFAMSKDGEFWELRYEGRVIRLRDRKGLQYLAVLADSAGRPIPALQLLTGSGPSSGPAPRELHVDSGAPVDDILDASARTAYRRRITELEAELSEAQEWNDLERAVRIQQELDFVVRELAAATGLGGRPRSAPSPAERARISVTRAIRNAIQAATTADATLGHYLDTQTHTGASCRFDFENPEYR